MHADGIEHYFEKVGVLKSFWLQTLNETFVPFTNKGCPNSSLYFANMSISADNAIFHLNLDIVRTFYDKYIKDTYDKQDIYFTYQ